MIRGLGRQKMIAALDGSFTAVVGIRRRAFPLVAAIRSLLIELPTGEAVERSHQQKNCQEDNGNVNASTHRLPE